VKIEEKIEELSKNKIKTEENILVLEKIKNKFNNVTIQLDRWRKEYVCSPDINSIADNYYTHHDCGCCDDSPLFIFPYIEFENVKIYSDPYKICIGEKNYEFGDKINDNCEEKLVKHNISKKIIEFVVTMKEEYKEKYEEYREKYEKF
jgi:hypothetical protein